MKIAPKRSSEEFLRANVAFTGSDCLLWPYKRVPSGYGLAVVGGIQKRASRWMCILAHGEPPFDKAEAAHSCGDASCVNPNHLRWATPKENAADKEAHGTVVRGERSGKTTLSRADVIEIRNAPPYLGVLMRKFGVSKGCLSKIRSGARWSHIQ